jgi:hypothetical protein
MTGKILTVTRCLFFTGLSAGWVEPAATDGTLETSFGGAAVFRLAAVPLALAFWMFVRPGRALRLRLTLGGMMELAWD